MAIAVHGVSQHLSWGMWDAFPRAENLVHGLNAELKTNVHLLEVQQRRHLEVDADYHDWGRPQSTTSNQFLPSYVPTYVSTRFVEELVPL
ncbi:MAG TPA: hypothetical protein VMF69_21595 [Gemmataceae bacterium]|nr:hypothetical protein [Gemmataceae bacterium]